MRALEIKDGDRVLFEAREVRAWGVKDETAAYGIKARPFPAEVREKLAKWTKSPTAHG